MQKDRVYLAQTDTTVGFLSKDFHRLNEIKKRDKDTPCIICVAEYKELLHHTRVPKRFKNIVRKAKKTTFIYPNKSSIRVVFGSHKEFIKEHKWLYSTSANITGCEFDEKYAKSVADEIVGEKFAQLGASKMFCINRTQIKRIR